MLDTTDFLNSLINYEKIPGYNYDLNAFRSFLDRFDAPQKKLPNIIHIAGTKGKGSVAALLQSCLTACGYRVGLFTSPHLSSVHERIRVDNKTITESEFEFYVQRVRPYIQKRQRARTYFEVLTTIALLHFLRKKTDFNILEVGLGGRLDSTNVTEPIISVITRIGYDHRNLLGHTLSDIAHEKAGIIKKAVPLITVHQRPSVLRIIRQTAKKIGTSILYADTVFRTNVYNVSLIGTSIDVSYDNDEMRVQLPLIGRHHTENLSLTLTVLMTLRSAGFRISNQAIKHGMARTKFRGRFDVITRKPLIIFDCAHNDDSYKALNDTITDVGLKDFTLVFGTSDNKEIDYCLKHIMPRAKQILIVQANHPRAVVPSQLVDRIRFNNRKVLIAGSVNNALEYVSTHARSTAATIITGSFYLWQTDWHV